MSLTSDRGRIRPPNLDDRTWQDLVDEMHVLRRRYAPQWTDESPSDLGVTLVELFAWLAEGLVYRLNQVPEKNYIAFLQLLGITRDPATPARTFLTFSSRSGGGTVPAGTQAQTPAGDGLTPVVFETDTDLTVLPTDLVQAVLIGPHAGGAGQSAYDDVTAAVVGPPTGNVAVTLGPGQAAQLCLGLDRPVAESLGIGVRLSSALPAAAAPAPPRVGVSWRFSSGATQPLSWPAVPEVADGTEGLQGDGQVRLTVPAAWSEQRPSAWQGVPARDQARAVTRPSHWLGLRLENTSSGTLTLGVDRILVNAVLARTALTVRVPEVIGQGTGQPFQVAQLRHRPLFRQPGRVHPYEHLVVELGTGTPPVWQRWAAVDEFPAGPAAVYRVDPVAGEILFGDDTGRGEGGHGSAPPPGSVIRATSYRHVASGAAGNVAAGSVTVPSTAGSGATLTGFRVLNAGPAVDGNDEEAVEETLRRAPQQLKVRDRAVTAEDYEFLAREADSSLRVRCLPPRLHTVANPSATPAWVVGEPWTFGGVVRSPGTVNLVVVPDRGADVPRPEPTPEQVQHVREHLDRRRSLAAALEVHGPRYLPIVVTVQLSMWPGAKDAGAQEDVVEAELRSRVQQFLHPTRGGPAGTGWTVGQPVFSSDLFRAIMPPADVGYLSALQVAPALPAYPGERPFPGPAGASVRLADYELVCAAPEGAHEIDVVPLRR